MFFITYGLTTGKSYYTSISSLFVYYEEHVRTSAFVPAPARHKNLILWCIWYVAEMKFKSSEGQVLNVNANVHYQSQRLDLLQCCRYPKRVDLRPARFSATLVSYVQCWLMRSFLFEQSKAREGRRVPLSTSLPSSLDCSTRSVGSFFAEFG